MKKQLLTLFVIVALIYSRPIYCQIFIDLAGSKNTTEPIDINKEPVLFLLNMLPDRELNKYLIKINLKEEKIPSFSLSKIQGSEDGCKPVDTDLANFYKAYNNLKQAENESSVPDLVDKLKIEITSLKPGYIACGNMGYALIKNTAEPPQKLGFIFKNNQTITIEISRITGKDTTIWTREFVTPKVSPWKVFYGFTFVPNKLSKVDNYFSKAVDSTNQSYAITKFNDNGNETWENISPTIMFQWGPMKKYKSLCKKNGGSLLGFLSNEFYQIGFVGGLSFNFAKETGNVNLMVGPSIIIADNISISGGLSWVQKFVLMGQYKEGDIIKEQLDFNQLHEKKYMLEYFISIAFRFDQNPFSGKKG